MARVLIALVMLAGTAVAQAPGGNPGGNDVTVQVGNVRNAHGLVHVDLCPQATFLTESCPYHAEAPARTGTTAVVVHNVAPGRYAAQVSHDENANRRVDRGLFGIPKEGVGFSNDARITLGPPRFADAVFGHGDVAQTIALRLRYFLGPSGPAAR